MKKLEDKIIKKVFVFETRKTFLEILLRVLVLFVLGFLSFIFSNVIIDILREQSTLDLFQILSEDFEVWSKYLWDVLYTFYQELPKVISSIFLFIFAALAVLLYVIIRNFDFIKNRVKDIIKFWLRDGKKI